MGVEKILAVDPLFFIGQWKNNSRVKRIPNKSAGTNFTEKDC
jgi:hypothetical protein